MNDFAWPTTVAGAIVCGGALWYFRNEIKVWLTRQAEKPAPSEIQNSEARHLEPMLATEQRHRDHEAQIAERHAAEIARITKAHSETHAKDQRTKAELTQEQTRNEKTIERLTASNTAKDAEIAKLKAEIEELRKQIPPPRKPGSTWEQL